MISPSTYFSRHAQALLSAFGRLIRQPLGTVLTVFVIAIDANEAAAAFTAGTNPQ